MCVSVCGLCVCVFIKHFRSYVSFKITIIFVLPCIYFYLCQVLETSYCSVTKLCLTLCDPVNTMLPCPSLSPWVFWNSCPLSQWCHPTISSCVAPSPLALSLSQCQGLYQNWLFLSGGQIGASASAPVLPVNIQDWFLLGLSGLISLLSKGLSSIFSSTTIWKHQFFGT